ncbi:MAG TPA: HAD family hydrolase [Rhodospirillaceae bacterium]|nr:HAD family hydrolase [Rhodospirillaceae bacterium]HAT36304.1 HAD family hydrolase [Rhodospirillaceae bacterium]
MTIASERPDAILFDWDNTLVDSWLTIHAALVETFTQMDHEPWTLSETKDRVRQSLRDSFPGLFGDRWEEAAAIFYSAFERLHIENLVPMPQAGDMLERVQKVVPVLGVVSNKTGKYLRQEAQHLDWQCFFHELIGAGDASRDKPNAAPVDLFRKNNGLGKDSRIWYVGDSDIDMETAQNSGCIPVLIHIESANLDQIGANLPEITLSDCEELAGLVETL